MKNTSSKMLAMWTAMGTISILLIVFIIIFFIQNNQIKNLNKKIIEDTQTQPIIYSEEDNLSQLENDTANDEISELNEYSEIHLGDNNTFRLSNNNYCYVKWGTGIELGDSKVLEISKKESINICEAFSKLTPDKNVYIDLLNKQDNFIQGFVGLTSAQGEGASPFVVEMMDEEYNRTVFNRNDSPTCAEVDGIGVEKLLPKCLDNENYEARDTK